jgi:hypothetical protein
MRQAKRSPPAKANELPRGSSLVLEAMAPLVEKVEALMDLEGLAEVRWIEEAERRPWAEASRDLSSRSQGKIGDHHVPL